MVESKQANEDVVKDAVEFLGRWYDADPQGFEETHARILADLESKGYR